MPPITQSIQLDRAERLQNVLGGGVRGRDQAVSAAFDQLFTGQLSGQQADLAQSTVKNRIARGLRGAAAEAAQTRLEQGFRASNRVAASGALAQLLGRSELPVVAGIRRQSGGIIGEFRGTQLAAGTSAFQTFAAETAGLRALGLEDGAASVNQRIEQALAASGGDREAAFASIFGSTGLASVQQALNARDTFAAAITQQEDLIRGQLDALRNTPIGTVNRTFSTRNNIEQLTPDLLDRLGVDQSLIATMGLGPAIETSLRQQGTTLSARAREVFGLTDENIQVGLGRTGNTGGAALATTGLEFTAGGDLVSQANLLLGLGDARNRFTGLQVFGSRLKSLRSALRQNVGQLEGLREAESRAGPGAERIGSLGRQREELAGIDPTSARGQELTKNISQAEQFRREQLSPATPFFA